MVLVVLAFGLRAGVAVVRRVEVALGRADAGVEAAGGRVRGGARVGGRRGVLRAGDAGVGREVGVDLAGVHFVQALVCCFQPYDEIAGGGDGGKISLCVVAKIITRMFEFICRKVKSIQIIIYITKP